ncbi:hypothetical protein BDY19DRAFT_927625 [Irpex rosettiformis]|uniref:Uncharacterized protein n=1 Tax=Irpex rosettiformis TaxID=378272 RepID=A0ACB8UCG6_9APHY|nr:hypothetical protein BDY19DRAFT_927625 [Irpex rosettiformis]
MIKNKRGAIRRNRSGDTSDTEREPERQLYFERHGPCAAMVVIPDMIRNLYDRTN